MAQVDPRYKPFGPIARELVRNGIAHSFATKGKIGITRIGGRDDHLVRVSDEKIIVINADCFFDDFKSAYKTYVRPYIGPSGKMRTQALDNYEVMRQAKENEITRTMTASEAKLDDWPWLNKQVVYSPVLVDKIEETGRIS